MSITRLAPQQFDFRQHWLTTIWPLMKTTSIAYALHDLTERYEEIAQFAYEESASFDEGYAREVLELDRHKARVLIRDLHWLRKTFGADDLANLSLSIAETLYPTDQWEILEEGDYFVVTNLNRSLVLDMKNCDQLSGQASLLMAGDPGSAQAMEEVIAFRKKRIAEEVARIEKLRSDIDRFSKEGTVSSLQS